MAEYKEVAKSFNKHMDALEYWLNTNTEKGVTHVPEGILEATVEDYKAICKFDAVPAVRAHWTEKRFPGGDFWDYSFVCSHCHHETPVRGYSISPDYCPGCGAKMDGEDGEQNA